MVLGNVIWCAKPDSLNDENEFKFKLKFDPSLNTADLLSQLIERYRTTDYSLPNLSASRVLRENTLEQFVAPIIENLVHQCRNTIGVTSFSAIKTDSLWNKYGGNGNGVCVEINIPDSLIGQTYHRVDYVAEKVFHVDCFLKSALSSDMGSGIFRNILLTKTMEWSDEEEIRFIGKLLDVNLIIDGHISEITFGSRIPLDILKKLKDEIANHCHSNNIIIRNDG